jgi:hypothetical protein
MVSMLWPSPRKQQARKTRRGQALIKGDGLLLITSTYPWCLVPYEVHQEIKNLRGKSEVCPRHPLRTIVS